MKAIVLRETGGTDKLKLEEIATPRPGPGEVLIKVEAVSVNRTLDFRVREGTYPFKPQLPHILGSDPCGVVAEVGEGVTDRKVGDRVACGAWGHQKVGRGRMPGVHFWGGYAEYIRIASDATRDIPDNVDFNTAVVIARHGPIAFNQLDVLGGVKQGDTVLVMGASGGIGNIAVQVAKMLGAYVIAGAGADDRVAAAIEVGADVGVNYSAHNLLDEVRRITDSKGVDVVLDNISDPKTFSLAFESLAIGGRLITAGTHGGGTVQVDINRLYLKSLRLIGGLGGSKQAYDLAMRAAGDGKLKVNVAHVMPLSEVRRAHEIIADRDTLGKVLLSPALDVDQDLGAGPDEYVGGSITNSGE